MKYFRVRAKCGHVGSRKNYIELDFYTIADNGSEAARIVRMAPRVKHHHKDAIRFVEEINIDEYLVGKAEYANDPYTQCKNKQQQDKFWELISARVMPEKIFPDFRAKKKKAPNPRRSFKYGYLNDKKISIHEYISLMDLDYAY